MKLPLAERRHFPPCYGTSHTPRVYEDLSSRPNQTFMFRNLLPGPLFSRPPPPQAVRLSWADMCWPFQSQTSAEVKLDGGLALSHLCPALLRPKQKKDTKWTLSFHMPFISHDGTEYTYICSVRPQKG